VKLALVAILAAVSTAGMPHTSSQHHEAVDRRGAQVMGFDQQKTTHHFLLYEDGGAIDVAVKDASDTTSLDAIRSHLPHIATMFADGRFDAPMLVHDVAVPGTAEMTRLKDRVRYQYVRTANGGRVDITTSDPDALAAVHRFLRFQIDEHRTGDPTTVRKR